MQPIMEWIFVSLASALAGFVDAIVGGGGLILVPAMFAAFPPRRARHLVWHQQKRGRLGYGHVHLAIQPPHLHHLGHDHAGHRSRRGGRFCWRMGSDAGQPDFLRKLLPFILLGVLLYTLAKKELGRDHAPSHHSVRATQ